MHSGIKQVYNFSVAQNTPVASVPESFTLTGTWTSTGKKFVGTGTDLAKEVEVGDYIYIPSSGEVRRVIRLQPHTTGGLTANRPQQFFVNLPLNADVTDEANVLLIPSGSISTIEAVVAGTAASFVSAYVASLQTVGGTGITGIDTPLEDNFKVENFKEHHAGPIIFITGATTTIEGYYTK